MLEPLKDKRKGMAMLHAIDSEALEIDHLKALLDHTRDLIWSVDRNFKLIAFNRAFKEKFKPLSGDTAAKGSHILAGDLQLITFYERALSGEAFIEIECFQDPIETWLEISFFPIQKDGNVIGATCHSREITQIRKEEHRLKLLESVVTNATDSVLITEASPPDEAGQKIVYVNDALIEMTGYARDEILGKTPRMLQGPKSDLAQLAYAIKCLAQSKPCQIEIVNYKKNGDEFWMHIAIVPISDENGQATHFISIGRDVTERFENMEAIRAQNIKLKDIARVQSHEVRGPLARIKGLINLLSNHSHSKEDTELMGYLNLASDEMDIVIRKIIGQAEEINGFVK